MGRGRRGGRERGEGEGGATPGPPHSLAPAPASASPAAMQAAAPGALRLLGAWGSAARGGLGAAGRRAGPARPVRGVRGLSGGPGAEGGGGEGGGSLSGAGEVAEAFRASNPSALGLRGHVVRGHVRAVARQGVLVDPRFRGPLWFLPHELAGKHVAHRPGSAAPPAAGAPVEVGDVVELLVEDPEGLDGEMVARPVDVLHNGKDLLVWEAIKDAFERGAKVKGRVLNPVNGGFAVGIGGFVAFLPESRAPQATPAKAALVGRLVAFDVLGLKEENQNIIVGLLPSPKEQARLRRDAKRKAKRQAAGKAAARAGA